MRPAAVVMAGTVFLLARLHIVLGGQGIVLPSVVVVCRRHL